MNTFERPFTLKWRVSFFVFVLTLAVPLSSFDAPTMVDDNDDPFVVVLDAGHGGHDPGNLGNGYLEKNIALNIVLNVGSILKRNPNIKVIYTRDNDTFVDLYVRGEIANKANADLFVSVHCDSHTSDAHGAGTFVLGLHANKQNFEIAKKENSVIYLEDNYEARYADYDINSPESIIGLTIMQEEFLDQSIALAKNMQDNFTGKLNRKDREVKQAGFIVLHQTFMPSVLVETGFLTNKEEGAYLNSRKGQSEMGTAIAEAILSYQAGVATTSSSIASSEELIVSKDDALAQQQRQAEEAKIAEAAEIARKVKEVEAAKQAAEALAEKQRQAEQAKIAEAAEMAKKAKEAEAAKQATEALAEKQRLAEEAKIAEAAEMAKKAKEAEAAKQAAEALAEKQRLAEEAKDRRGRRDGEESKRGRSRETGS